LDYKYIKRLKNSSIKDDYRKALNYKLKSLSENAIDLLQKMLHKDPLKRIDMIGVFEHPWMIKYERKFDGESSSGEELIQTDSESEQSLSSESNDDQSENYSRSNSATSNLLTNDQK